MFRFISIHWISTDELLRASRTPETLTLDATCKTNAFLLPLIISLGCDALGKNSPWLISLFDGESKNNYTFLLTIALPLFYGNTLEALSIICSDGDRNIKDSIDAALKRKAIGHSLTVRGGCFFHGVCQTYLREYSSYGRVDGGVGETVKGIITSIFFNAENQEEHKVLENAYPMVEQ